MSEDHRRVAVVGITVVIVAAVGLGVDALTALLTWSTQKGSVNSRELLLHDLSGALASIAAITAVRQVDGGGRLA